MHAHQLIHPWQHTAEWSRAHRRATVVVVHPPDAVTSRLRTGALVTAMHRALSLPTPRTLPEHRSHFYPSRCRYLESAAMSRAMYRL